MSVAQTPIRKHGLHGSMHKANAAGTGHQGRTVNEQVVVFSHPLVKVPQNFGQKFGKSVTQTQEYYVRSLES